MTADGIEFEYPLNRIRLNNKKKNNVGDRREQE